MNEENLIEKDGYEDEFEIETVLGRQMAHFEQEKNGLYKGNLINKLCLTHNCRDLSEAVLMLQRAAKTLKRQEDELRVKKWN